MRVKLQKGFQNIIIFYWNHKSQNYWLNCRNWHLGWVKYEGWHSSSSPEGTLQTYWMRSVSKETYKRMPHVICMEHRVNIIQGREHNVSMATSRRLHQIQSGGWCSPLHLTHLQPECGSYVCCCTGQSCSKAVIHQTRMANRRRGLWLLVILLRRWCAILFPIKKKPAPTGQVDRWMNLWPH